jgi:rhamnosyltransferase
MEPLAVIGTAPLSPFAQSICAVVVTYFPDSDLLNRLRRVTAQIAQTVVVDNGSPQSSIEAIKEFGAQSGIHLISNSSNEGIASALNAGTRWAASRGFNWVLTLDQDTLVAPDMVDIFAAVVDSRPAPERLAVIGSNYRDKINGKLFREHAPDTDGSLGTEMVSVLTSGSLVSIAAFQAIGGFRNDFFIDCVDHEYCLHARALGFHVILTSKPVMEHGIGHLTQHRLFWKTVFTSNHSPLRHYFLARNSVVLVREYLSKEARWILSYLWGWLKYIALVFLFEKERTKKMKYILRGAFDGFLGRTGPLTGSQAVE